MLQIFQWITVVVLVGLGVAGNFYYATQPLLYRVLVLVVVGAVALVIALQTAQGKVFAALVREAQIEIRKVVWPTRQETGRYTLVVIALSVAVALFLAFWDYIFQFFLQLFLLG